MIICLDTNIVIGILNQRRPVYRARLTTELLAGTRIVLPVTALFELQYGIAKSDRAEASRQVLRQFLLGGVSVIPFEAEDAQHAGDIRAALERAGTPIGPYDVLIAAQARRIGAVLVSDNLREFSRVPGLAISDWMD
ncbi:MAG: type II toxin-antitoxin system VapC family toxin [Bosea sp. (in: a-proteobacteria)]